MCGDRLLPAGVGVDRLGVGAQLQGREPQDLPVDLQGRLSGESAEHPHEGDLVRETQPVVGPRRRAISRRSASRKVASRTKRGREISGSETGTALSERNGAG